MRNIGIVPPNYRGYSEVETAALRERFSADVAAEYAAPLQASKGIRLWWLKWRLEQEVERRVREHKRQGV